MSSINNKIIDRLIKTKRTAELALHNFDSFTALNKEREMRFNISNLANLPCDKFVDLEAIERMKRYGLKLANIKIRTDEMENLSSDISYLCTVAIAQVKVSDVISSLSEALEKERKNITGELTADNRQLLALCLSDFYNHTPRTIQTQGVDADVNSLIKSITHVQAGRFEEEVRQVAFDGVDKSDKDAYAYADAKLAGSKIDLENAECFSMEMVVEAERAVSQFSDEFSKCHSFNNKTEITEAASLGMR